MSANALHSPFPSDANGPGRPPGAPARQPGKAYRGMGMDGIVAHWYARNTQKSIADYQALAERVSTQLPAGSRVLEVAPGPGYFAIELAKRGPFHVVGIDISATCVEIARKRAQREHVAVDFQIGDAAHLPIESASVDFILCRAAFKNFADPLGALQEMHRVLKPGGSGLLIDLSKDATPASIAQAVDGMGLNRINRWLTRLIFRFVLLKRAYTEKQFRDFFTQSGFTAVDIQAGLIGFDIRFTR
jgi:ubiquinone/menaquinone biosynthesis C-methylase UbiE